MTTNTHDFTGDYNWAEEEARGMIAYFEELLSEGHDRDYLCQLVIKERQHWLKVFGQDEQGKKDMQVLTDTFNKYFAEKINFYM